MRPGSALSPLTTWFEGPAAIRAFRRRHLGRAVGLVELLVEESRGEHLLASLESRGWVTHR